MLLEDKQISDISTKLLRNRRKVLRISANQREKLKIIKSMLAEYDTVPEDSNPVAVSNSLARIPEHRCRLYMRLLNDAGIDHVQRTHGGDSLNVFFQRNTLRKFCGHEGHYPIDRLVYTTQPLDIPASPRFSEVTPHWFAITDESLGK
ncbi:MAG: hypothetical protein K2X29_13620 [Candidatus Obscuribacterales bacterium]|nr:hypothetical protein [Candidatus Obscuribacterales bacterium]